MTLTPTQKLELATRIVALLEGVKQADGEAALTAAMAAYRKPANAATALSPEEP